MTEKLYYKDAYLKEFEASVISATKTDRGYDIVLDKTAFFPEEGGQSADSGKIADASVLYVYEKCGVIHHLTDKAPSEERVRCAVDFDERFEKMQIHTAEHILSGIIKRRFGAENVGFHLGDEVVTFDTSLPLTWEQLISVEREANEAVYKNCPVNCYFPTAEQAKKAEYRSKMDIEENLRLVEILGVDICACCAPHVGFTGEIGIIKILSSEKHKGGTRVYMSAGRRAYEFIKNLHCEAVGVSNLLSSPILGICDSVKSAEEKAARVGLALKNSYCKCAELQAKALTPTEGNLAVAVEGVDTDGLMRFANLAKAKVGGVLVALQESEADGSYKYIIMGDESRLPEIVKKANAALDGRGGGRAGVAQGSFRRELSEIISYFENMAAD